MRMIGTLALAVLTISLASCGTVRFKAEPGVVPCPALIDYTPEQQAQAAAAVEAGLPDIVTTMLADYKGVRDQIRTCRAAR